VNRLAALLVLIAVSLAPASCGRNRSTDHHDAAGIAPDSSARDTSRAEPTGVPAAIAPAVRYRAIVLANPAGLRALRDSLGADAFAVMLQLNRIDLAHARSGDTLVLPEPADTLACSPFPTLLGAADSLPKLLLVSNRVQAWAAYEAGHRVRWGVCCTGRETKQTPVGLFHTNWRQTERHSTIDGSWLLRWYVNLDAMAGVSFHVFDLPGRPSSHSCVRLSERDALWIYRWCDTWQLADRRHVAVQGTPTLVLDRWAFGHRRPWRALPANPRACDVPADSIAAALAGYGLATSPAAPPDSTSRAASRNAATSLDSSRAESTVTTH
jgi:hypothetical protein